MDSAVHSSSLAFAQQVVAYQFTPDVARETCVSHLYRIAAGVKAIPRQCRGCNGIKPECSVYRATVGTA